MPVRLLTDDTIGKIAAGEVVERPASVVKELLENAIDAGARQVRLTVRGGGLELLEMQDDGCGMTGDDLALAVQRHATSKLVSFDELDRLGTLGFRGEALPSIAAVSRLTVRSRPPALPAGAELAIDFGAARPARAVGMSPGTTVTVRDLFANVPARRKFLRQPSTEAAYITRTVAAYAAAYPEISWTMFVDDRRVVATDGAGDPIGAAVGAMGREIAEAAIAFGPLDETAAVPGVEVSGWVGAPSLTRSHRQGIVFFANGRWIQHRGLSFALEEAYHSLLMVGRHPVAMVWIEVDPAAVDVNVHPTKAEVKFLDERAVCRAVQRATHAALARSVQADLPAVRFMPLGGDAPAESARPLPFPQVAAWGRDLSGEERAAAPTDPVPAHPSGVPILRVLGQVAATFIIAEGPEGMYLIDQHAAHERVLYESILAQLTAASVDRQTLLDPLVVDLAPDEMAIADRSRDELAQLGFDLEPFSNGAIVVRVVPAMLVGGNLTDRLRRMLRELCDGGSGTSWLDSVAISAACHSSIRAGQVLSLPEMRELVAALERSSQPRACGHGRPTMLHVSQTDLERQFSRR